MIMKTDSNEDAPLGVDDCFDKHAALDQDGFYQALVDHGFPDLSTSHLATFVFEHLSSNSTSNCIKTKSKRISRERFHTAVRIASSTVEFVKKHTSVQERSYNKRRSSATFQMNLEEFQDLGSAFLSTKKQNDGNDNASNNNNINNDGTGGDDSFSTIREALANDFDHVSYFLDEETFSRYDTEGDGYISLYELLIFAYTLHIISKAFIDNAATATTESDSDSEDASEEGNTSTNSNNSNSNCNCTKYLTRETYLLAMEQIGIPNVSKIFQGQLYDSVYRRTDSDCDGFVTFGEFFKASMRLVYPVTHVECVKRCKNYPGWDCLLKKSSNNNNADAGTTITEQMVADLTEKLSTLQTGDVILMQDTEGEMGRFVSYSTNSPWYHAAVVVRRGGSGGSGGSGTDDASSSSPQKQQGNCGSINETTEELLRKFPFRRNTHRHCSPGYCRCFDGSSTNGTAEDYAPSKFHGLANIGLLEATGEGIHLYDLAHRLFESREKQWASMAIVRLHDAANRDDYTRINDFVEQVRGRIYTVAKNELGAALAMRRTSTAATGCAQLPDQDRATGDDFCAALVMRFYRHMGWVDSSSGSRPVNSVMSCDFAAAAESNNNDHRPSHHHHHHHRRRSSITAIKTWPVELLEGTGGRFGELEIIHTTDFGLKLPLKLPKKTKK